MVLMDFKKKRTKLIEVVGNMDEHGRVQMNMSRIYSKLIKEAAKCKSFASDVLFDISSIEDGINQLQHKDAMNIAIGFRECGTDSNTYMKLRTKNYSFIRCYTKMFVLHMECGTRSECSARLFEIDMNMAEQSKSEFMEILSAG